MEAFEFRVGNINSPIVIRVPAGFVTDFASVPWPLRYMFPPYGRWAKAAVIHDYLCDGGIVPRPIADWIFWDAMRNKHLPEDMRVDFCRALCLYLSVRLWAVLRRPPEAP